MSFAQTHNMTKQLSNIYPYLDRTKPIFNSTTNETHVYERVISYLCLIVHLRND